MRLASLTLSCLLFLPSLAGAQSDDEAPPADEGAPADPLADELPVAEAEPADVEPEPAACVPACRAGFVCASGECVSACNPACDEGSSCSADGECVPDNPVSGPGLAGGDPGYALDAGIMGIVMKVLSIGLYATVAVGTNNYWVDVGLRWGAIGLPFITAPIVGGGALSASGPGTEDLLPVRIGAWVLYAAYFGGSLAAAIYAGDHQGFMPDEATIALAIGGVAMEAAFIVDAFYAAIQANSASSAASATRVAPSASVVSSADGITGGVAGVAGLF